MTLTLSALAVTALISMVLPILVGLVTKLNAPSKLKGGLLIFLNFVSATIISVSSGSGDGTATFTVQSLILFGMSLIVSLATYYNVYEPYHVPEKLAPDFGLGRVAGQED
jgi:hypothetical protein